ncbi:MAG: GtrA family protein [Sphaerochaetaceae bacterium]|nr:GtrA family protein [Sphaerochaetaceae bacterium]
MNKEQTIHQSFAQIVKFTLFSISAGVIQTITFTLGEEIFKLPYWPSYISALVLSILWNFTLNRRYTFKSAANIPVAMLKLGVYYAIFTPLSTWLGQALVTHGANDYLVLFGTMLVNLATEFLVCKFFIYRGQINTRQKAENTGDQ